VVQADAGCLNLIVHGNSGLAGISAAGIYEGFYGTTPIAKQTGVAVTAAGIHAALVNLGLISA
jgi:hypothetical protein